jgi:hypothetical protein
MPDSANPFAGGQRQFQLPTPPWHRHFQSARVRAIQQGSSPNLCLQFEATGRRLDEDNIIARSKLERLPDAGGQGDPSSGLDSRGSLHRLA